MQLPARVALTGDIVPLKDEKVRVLCSLCVYHILLKLNSEFDIVLLGFTESSSIEFGYYIYSIEVVKSLIITVITVRVMQAMIMTVQFISFQKILLLVELAS